MIRTLTDTHTIWEKEMRIWAKTPAISLGRAFIMPFIWLVIFGSVFGGSATHVPIALVMEDDGHNAQAFTQLLMEGNSLKITANTNYQHALKLLENRAVAAVIFIPPDFSDNIDAGETGKVHVSIDATTPLLAGTVSSRLMQSQQAFKNKLMLEYMAPESRQLVQSIDVQENVLFGRGMRYLDFMAAGVVVQVIVFTSLFAGGLGYIMDREIGTLKMVMAAPIDKMAIVLGKITAGVTQATLSGGIALALAVIMGVQIKTGVMGLALVFIMLALVAFGFIGMTVAFATRIHSLESFSMAIPTIIMPVWFLSGSLYPIETMPAWLKPFAVLNPLTYATEAVRSLMVRGVIWSSLAFDFIVIILFSVLMVFIGTKTFKRTL
ncbi:MAG: ABC transporter permease [Candidatus Micrarchaeota archaeon]